MDNDEKRRVTLANGVKIFPVVRVADIEDEPPRTAEPWVFGRWYVDWTTNPAYPFVSFRRGAKPNDSDYYVPMDRCLSVVEAEDWIRHLAEKSWCDGIGTADLARALVATMAEMERNGMTTRLRRQRQRKQRGR